MDHIYLYTDKKTLVVKNRPAAPHFIARYLIKSIITGKNNFKIEVASCFSHEDNSFNTYGSARLEILFYEKTSCEQSREQITMYGIAENTHFQVQSFTIFCDTCWFESANRHPEHNYFDSIILDLSPSSPLITGSSLELNFRNPAGMVSAHSSVVLRFDPKTTPRSSHSVLERSLLPEAAGQTT